jgi:threonine/homoserine/homoserine lactone efflux protein
MDALAAVMFLGMVILISISGALGPGPVLAATISKGYDDERSGLKIATGHMLIEVPLIAGIYLGLETVLRDETLLLIIGLVGGAFLIYMGADMVRSDKVGYSDGGRAGASAFTVGALTTAANPYFFLWWATVGATLITDAVEFGLIMLPIFAMVHLSVDYGWLQFVSFSVFRSKGLWSEKRHRIIFIASGAIMVVFGAYFLLSSLGSIL